MQRETGGRAVKAEAIHLTLAFLGEADPEKAAAAAESVRGARHALPLEQAHYWPHNHIVWVGPLATPAPLAALAGALGQALAQAGFELEEREFQAHITLIRKARAKRALPAFAGVSWPVEEFALIRSELSAEGASYSVLERFALA